MSMRTFKHFPEETKCSICNTNANMECILVPIYGTIEDNLVQAVPAHIGCIGKSLVYYPTLSVFIIKAK